MADNEQKLGVWMNGFLVGTLTRKNGAVLVFCYDKNWLTSDNARPISLSLPLIERQFTGDKVHHFFDNLLPDNNIIRSRIQAKFQVKTNQAFDLLTAIGKDCIGAIQLSHNKIPVNKKIKAKHLDEKAIANTLRNFQTAPLGMRDKDQDFRISIAGAQEKTALLRYHKKWYLPLEATPTSHIFKLPIGFINHQNMDLSESCENEWLCTQIAKAFNIPVANAFIENFLDTKTLVVERFDRKWLNENYLMRLPQEDFCQALGVSSNLKYEADGGPAVTDMMRLLLGSVSAEKDREIFFRSQILFFLLAAIDGHAKNFSVFIEPKGNYRLTPLYDIMSAYPLIEKKQLQAQKIKMAMALIGNQKHYRWHNIQRRHFISTAIAAKFSPEKAETILQEMTNQVEHVISIVLEQLPINFPKQISEAIFQGMLAAKKRLKVPCN